MTTGATAKTDRATIEYLDTVGFGADVGGRGFHIPVDISVRPDGHVYAINKSPMHRLGIRVGICDVHHGWYGEFGGDGRGDGQFTSPTAITHGPDDRIYIADEQLNRITVFTPEGEYESKWGEQGSEPGQINGPAALKFTQNGDLLVVDHLNNRIQRMTADGKYISHWGSFGAMEGEFNLPWGIDIDSAGNIYVADWRNDRIQRFTADGEFIDMYGSSGTEEGQFDRPSDVAVDDDGYIYVADWTNQRVQMFDKDWNFQASLRGQATVSPWAQDYLNANADEADARSRFNPYIEVDTDVAHEVSARVEAYFWDPIAVEIDPEGRLIVADSLRHRLQIYKRVSE
ncbi:MAG: NHL repeat-containing protein [Chloroflexi bacterium]|nr:NHL repeat-containing protein [Chloroflexota bacterium]